MFSTRIRRFISSLLVIALIMSPLSFLSGVAMAGDIDLPVDDDLEMVTLSVEMPPDEEHFETATAEEPEEEPLEEPAGEPKEESMVESQEESATSETIEITEDDAEVTYLEEPAEDDAETMLSEDISEDAGSAEDAELIEDDAEIMPSDEMVEEADTEEITEPTETNEENVFSEEPAEETEPEQETETEEEAKTGGAKTGGAKAESTVDFIYFSADLREFVTSVEIFDLSEDTPRRMRTDLEPIFPETLYMLSIEFSETETLQMQYNSGDRLQYRLLDGLLVLQAVPQTAIRNENGNLLGWYTIDEYGLVEVWFDNVDSAGGPIDINFIDSGDIGFALNLTAMFDETADDSIDFGNGVLLSIWLIIPELPMMAMDIELFSIGDPGWQSDLSNFITGATMWTQDAGGNWVLVPMGTPAYIGQTYRFDLSFSEGDTADLQFAYNADGYLTYQLPAGITIQNAIGWTPIRLSNNNIVGWYSISDTGFVELYFDNVDANGNPRPSNFIDDPQAYFTLQIFAQYNGNNLDFGSGGIITVIPQPPPPQISVNKTSRYDPDAQRVYYTITITALGGSVTNIGLTDTPTVNGGMNISNPVTNEAFSPPALQVTRFDTTESPPVAITPPSDLPSPAVTWPSRNPASFQISLLRNADGTPLELQANEFATITFYVDLQKLIANNLTILNPSTTSVYNFSVENTVGVVSSVNPLPVTDNAVDIVKKILPINKSGTLITADDGAPQSIRWTTTIGDGSTTLLNSVPSGVGTVGGNIIDILGPPLTSANIIPTTPGGDVRTGIEITFTSFASSAPTVPIVRTITANQLIPGVFNITTTGFTFQVPTASTMFPTYDGTDYNNVYQITIVYYTDITGAMTGVGSAGSIFTNSMSFDGVPSVANVPARPGGFTLSKSTNGMCGSMTAVAPNVGPNGERYYIDYEIRLNVPANQMGNPIYLYDIFGVWPGNTGAPNSVNGVTGQDAAFNGIGSPNAGVFVAPAGTPITDTITPDGTWETLTHYVSGGGVVNAWSMFFGDGSTNFTNNSWPFNDARVVVIRYRLWITEGTYDSSTTTDLLGRLQSRVVPFANYVQNTVYLIDDYAGPQIWPPAGVSPNFILGVNVNDYWPITKQGAETVGDPTLFNYTVIVTNNYTFSPSNGNPTMMQTDLYPIFTDTHDPRMDIVPGSFFVHVPGTNGGWFAPVGGAGITAVPGAGVFTVDISQLQRVSSSATMPTNPGTWPTTGDGVGIPAGWWGTSAIFDIHYQLRLTDNTATPAEQSAGTILLNNTASLSRNGLGTCTFDASWVVDYDLNPLTKAMTPTDIGSNRIDVEIIINPDGLTDFLLDGVSLPAVTAIDRLENLKIFLDTINFETKDTSPSLGAWRPLTGTGTEVVGFNQDTPWAINYISDTQVNFVIPNQTPVRITYQAMVTLPAGTSGSISNQIEIWGITSGDGSDDYLVTDQGVTAGGSAVTLRVYKVDAAGNPLPTNGGVGDPSAVGVQFELWGALLPDYATNEVPSSGSGSRTKVMTASDGTTRTFFYFGTQTDTNLTGMVAFNGFLADGISDGVGLLGSGNILFVLVETVAPTGGYLPPEPLNYTFFTINPAIDPGLIADAEALWGNIRTGVSDFIAITNEPTGEMILEKSFIFDPTPATQAEIDALIASASELSFLVIGTRGLTEIYRNTFYLTDFIRNPDGTFTLHIENLPFGTYSLFEQGGVIPGFTGPGVETPGMYGTFLGFVAIPGIDPESGLSVTSVTIPIINRYEGLPTRDVRYLRVNKAFHGLVPEEYPADFELIVTGPDGFITTITLADAVAGVILDNLAPGTYVIDERNYSVDGFDVTTDPALPYSVSLIDQNAQLTIQINNRYTPTDPNNPQNPPNPNNPQNPSPPTDPSDPGYPTDPPRPGRPHHPTNPPYPHDPIYPPYPQTPIEPVYPGDTPDRSEPPEPTEPEVPPDQPDRTTPPSPQTGDMRSITPMIVLFVIGVLCVVAGVVNIIRRRKLE